MQEPDVTISPDGAIRVEWMVNTGRMSHEIWSPKVIVAATGRTLFDLRDPDLDVSFDWLDHGAFRMSFRWYSRGGNMTVFVDVPRGAFRIGEGPEQILDDQAERKITSAYPWKGGVR
jgi:hypothetical protein